MHRHVFFIKSIRGDRLHNLVPGNCGLDHLKLFLRMRIITVREKTLSLCLQVHAWFRNFSCESLLIRSLFFLLLLEQLRLILSLLHLFVFLPSPLFFVSFQSCFFFDSLGLLHLLAHPISLFLLLLLRFENFSEFIVRMSASAPFNNALGPRQSIIAQRRLFDNQHLKVFLLLKL
jgi:hypothetical protein